MMVRELQREEEYGGPMWESIYGDLIWLGYKDFVRFVGDAFARIPRTRSNSREGATAGLTGLSSPLLATPIASSLAMLLLIVFILSAAAATPLITVA